MLDTGYWLLVRWVVSEEERHSLFMIVQLMRWVPGRCLRCGERLDAERCPRCFERVCEVRGNE